MPMGLRLTINLLKVCFNNTSTSLITRQVNKYAGIDFHGRETKSLVPIICVHVTWKFVLFQLHKNRKTSCVISVINFRF